MLIELPQPLPLLVNALVPSARFDDDDVLLVVGVVRTKSLVFDCRAICFLRNSDPANNGLRAGRGRIGTG